MKTPLLQFGRGIALWCLCAAYLQGALTKAFDFDAALAEVQHFGLTPAAPLSIALIVFELVASAAVISGRGRVVAAFALAGFTLLATGLALRFWELPVELRIPGENAFFEHLGLAGGFIWVACTELRDRRAGTQ